MRYLFKHILFLSLITTTIVFSGCTKQKQVNEPDFLKTMNAKEGEELKSELQKEMDSSNLESINLYFRSPQTSIPMYKNQVMDMKGELDKKTSGELNTIVNFHWIETNKYDEEIKVLINSNADVDGVEAMNFIAFLANDMLTDLTVDIKKYAPNYYQSLDENMPERIKSAMHDEKIYYLPNMEISTSRYCVLARKDLLSKYNITDISDIEEYEEFLQIIKANEENILPGYIHAYYFMDFYMLSQGYLSLSNIYGEFEENELKIYTLEKLEEFDMAYNILKNWSNNELVSVKQNDILKLLSGEAASTIVNISMLQQLEDYLSNIPDVEFEIYPLSMDNVQTRRNSATGGLAIPKSSKKSKNVIQFYEWVQGSQDNYDLLMYGIEGKHYSIQDDRIKIIGTKLQNTVSGWNGSINFKNYNRHRSSLVNKDQYRLLLEQLSFENTVPFIDLAEQHLSNDVLGYTEDDIIKFDQDLKKIREMSLDINEKYSDFLQDISSGNFKKTPEEYKQELQYNKIDEFIEFIKEIHLKYASMM